jgi:Flp pilus assembly protein TadD
VRRIAAAVLAACALGLSASAQADPEETDPDLAKRDADYAVGVQAVKDKQWTQAIEALRKAERRNPESADLQNFLGFSYRNLKQFDAAFEHYERAIKLDPRHRGAHEYIGEAYLMVGDLANAEKHRAQLQAICLLGCEELVDLDKAIAAYKARPAR